MKLQDQCCSLEQAKRLKELGIVQDASNFYFGIEPGFLYGKGPINAWHTATFLVGELGVMLPTAYDTMRMHKAAVWLDFDSDEEGWKPYNDDGNDILGDDVFFPTEAQARAAMIIYLLENELTTASEVNARLKNKEV